MSRSLLDQAANGILDLLISQALKGVRLFGSALESGVDLGLGASGLADEDGNAGVVALHGWVGPGDE